MNVALPFGHFFGPFNLAIGGSGHRTVGHPRRRYSCPHSTQSNHLHEPSLDMEEEGHGGGLLPFLPRRSSVHHLA